MSGDPAECRQHMLDCAELAEHATTPCGKLALLDLRQAEPRQAHAMGFLGASLTRMEAMEAVFLD